MLVSTLKKFVIAARAFCCVEEVLDIIEVSDAFACRGIFKMFDEEFFKGDKGKEVCI